MFDHFFEWLASTSSPRFRVYREARFLYEAYLRGLTVQFDELSPYHYKEAAQDERLRRSEQLYRQAIDLSREANDLQDVAIGLYQLGMLLHLKGKFEEAARSFQDSLRILEDLPQSQQTAISGCYYHLGLIALHRGHIEEASRYVSQSLEIDTAIGDVAGVALCGSVLAKCDKVESANASAGGEEGEGDEYAAAGAAGTAYDSDSDANGRAAPQPPKAQRASPPRVDAGKQEPESLLSAAFGQDVVWLLSHSAAANDRFMGALEQLAGQLPRKLVVVRAAFGSQVEGRSAPPPLAPDERLCAAVLILEKDGLGDDNLRYWANWCIQTVATRDDFRLFVCLDDMTADEIGKYARRDLLLATLQDTVQFLVSPTPEHLCATLKTYLQRFDDIRKEGLWRRMRAGAAVTLGRVASAIQLCSGAIVGILALAALLLGRESVVARLIYTNNALVALVVGVAWFPVLTTPMFLLSQGLGAANSLIRDSPRIRRWLFLFALFPLAAAIELPERAGTPAAWLALGIVLGMLLDVARRDGWRAQQAQLSLQRALELSDRPISGDIAKTALHSSCDPLRYPLAPPIAPQIFISYTLWSNWSATHAANLHTMLLGAGIHSFLDRAEIGEGSAWRGYLNRSITEANVFIAVLDEKAVTRKWVAAEMITSLIGRQLTGLPSVIVLTDAELSQFSAMLPVFRAVLQERETITPGDQVRFVTANESTLDTLVWGFHSQRYGTPSILPPRLTALLSFLTIPAVGIGTIGLTFGLIAILFAWLQYGGKFDSSAILSSWGVLAVAYLICGYWLGFTTRLSVASRFEVRHADAKILTWMHLLSSIGFLGLLAVWYVAVPTLIAGWAIALCGIGWLMANLYIGRIIQDNPGLGRSNG